MRLRATTSLAAGLWLLWLLLVVATLVMKSVGWHGSNNTSDSGLGALLVAFLAFATMGALVAARVPRNPLGWLFMAIALGVAVGGIADFNERVRRLRAIVDAARPQIAGLVTNLAESRIDGPFDAEQIADIMSGKPPRPPKASSSQPPSKPASDGGAQGETAPTPVA